MPRGLAPGLLEVLMEEGDAVARKLGRRTVELDVVGADLRDDVRIAQGLEEAGVGGDRVSFLVDQPGLELQATDDVARRVPGCFEVFSEERGFSGKARLKTGLVLRGEDSAAYVLAHAPSSFCLETILAAGPRD
ncbi:MAG: hypothetical protein AAGE01_09895 [Pseudomonadota bacterium]